MRIFYQISARVCDMFNDESKPGWATAWGLLSIVVLTVVFTGLISSEKNSAENKQAQNQKIHHVHCKSSINTHVIHTSKKTCRSTVAVPQILT